MKRTTAAIFIVGKHVHGSLKWLARQLVMALFVTGWILSLDMGVRVVRAQAWEDPVDGVSRAVGNSLWCQLAGCAITGNVTVGGTLGVTGVGTFEANLIANNGAAARRTTLGTVSSLPGIWMGTNTTTPSVANYTMLNDGSNTLINAPTGAGVNFRVNNSDLVGLTAGALSIVPPTTFTAAIIASSALNKGSKTMSGGTNTATVTSGAKCTCTDESTAVATSCSVSGTTLTITSGVGTDVVTYHCF